MSTSLLSIPGLRQRRRSLCCLACGLQDVRLNSAFINLVLASNWSVEDIVTAWDPAVQNVLNSLSKQHAKAVDAIGMSLIEIYDKTLPPVVHQRYYQKDKLRFTVEGNALAMTFDANPGSILEIFYSNEVVEESNKILSQFEQQRMMIEKKGFVYGDLDVAFDKCLRISTVKQSFEVSWPSETSINRQEYNYGSSSEEKASQMETLQRHLIHYDNISLVMVDGISTSVLTEEDQDIPSINDWLQLFCSVYGDLSDIILVFAVPYSAFKVFHLAALSDVRKLVNRDVPESVRRNVLCLSLTNGIATECHQDT
ncbi:unnamed protein product [Orchesella dallaii]|uniref:Uncharacterized protein n=1 Tax=Orchesella dallaii TaxID=48710 RepID=A0ABP1QBM4_9HEXA